MPKETSLFVGAHDDDPMLGAFGQMHSDLQNGKDVHLVILTDGSFSHEAVFGIKDHPTRKELVKKRRQELLNAGKVLGLTSDKIHFLNKADGGGDLWSRDDSTINELKNLIGFLNPTTVYYHSGLDAHADHRGVNRIVSQIIKDKNINAFQYVIWSRELAEGRSDVDASKIPALPKETIKHRLSRETLLLKRQAIMCHKSQVENNPYPEDGWQAQPGNVLDQKFLDHFLKDGAEEVLIQVD